MYSEQTTSNFNAESLRRDAAEEAENLQFIIFFVFFSSRLCASPATLR